MAGARHGSEEDFRTVYRTLQPALLGYLTARLGDDDAAAEAAAAVWREIAQGVFSFRGDGTDFRISDASLARREVSDQPRSGQAEARTSGTDDVRRPLSALPPDRPSPSFHPRPRLPEPRGHGLLVAFGSPP
ncbi:hypothetical protein [Streptomyces sp. NPDC048825]|uniref:hypothetical protein n=1 Tax=Streptomyces sp. NPDC048825 TaxID=3365592 RepID=UPI00371EF49D